MSAQILIALPKSYLTTVGIEEIKQEPGDPNSPQVSRKRRLDHLSWEEKLQRKKLKNRVAAQTSRDRKKAKMDEMEYRIQVLESSNAKLAKDMASLKALNERLMGENDGLKTEITTVKSKMATGIVARADPAGPAESLPQQQEVSARSAVPVAFFRLLMLCLLCRTSFPRWTPTSTSNALSSLLKVSSEKLIQKLKTQIQIDHQDLALEEILIQKWWGPHQSMWNPVKIAS